MTGHLRPVAADRGGERLPGFSGSKRNAMWENTKRCLGET